MQSTLRALLDLQEIDRLVFKVEDELRRLPAERDRRRAEIDAKESVIAEKKEAIRQLRVQIKEIEDLTTGQRQRLRKLEVEASRNKVDAAMLASYEHEIRSVKRTVGQAEDDAIGMIDQAEALEAEVAALAAVLGEERRTFDEFSANVETETRAAEARLAELRAELETKQSHEVPAEQLALYRKVLASRGGEAMAELTGQICQGCYVGIPKNLAVRLSRGTELIQCPSCDRILFYPG